MNTMGALPLTILSLSINRKIIQRKLINYSIFITVNGLENTKKFMKSLLKAYQFL